jgi:hypothetical protein
MNQSYGNPSQNYNIGNNIQNSPYKVNRPQAHQPYPNSPYA